MKQFSFTILILGSLHIAISFPDSPCPDQCHCVEVSHDAPPGHVQMQEYMHKYDWLEGTQALGCWGRHKVPDVPSDLRQDVNYILLIGSKRRKKTLSSVQGDQPNYQSGVPLVRRPDGSTVRKTGQLKSLPVASFQGMSSLLQLDVSDNRLKRMEGREFDDLSNLRELSLRGNRMRNLPAGVFKNLTSVVALDLSENRLRGISDMTFINMRSLKRLFINNNVVNDLADSVFENLDSLEELNLANNRIQAIPTGLFRQLQRLKSLHLDGNKIRRLSYDFFLGMSSLQTLSVGNNRIAELSHYVFYYLPQLKSLDLSHNRLAVIETTMLWSQKGLLSLDVSHNNISRVHDLAFQHAASLGHLNIGNNGISEMSDLTFSGLKGLRQLVLSNNQISETKPDTFQGLDQLQTLSLSNNRLGRLERGFLDGLGELAVLYLDNNQISQLHGDEFRSVESSFDSKITSLYLRHNNLERLGPNIFKEMPNLRHLDLGFNNIRDIDIDALGRQMSLDTLLLNDNQLTEFSDGRLRTMQKLMKLDAAQNKIEKISRGAFTGMEKIENINLAGNLIDSLSPTVLYDIHSITQLNLNNNKLKHLPIEMFTSMHNLKTLLLADNNIDTLTMPLYPQVQLTRLDLSGNELDRIRGYITVALDDKATLGLAGNPWKCDCNIKNILTLFKKPKEELTMIDVDDIQCTIPTYYKARKLQDLSENDVTCDLAVHRSRAGMEVGDAQSSPSSSSDQRSNGQPLVNVPEIYKPSSSSQSNSGSQTSNQQSPSNARQTSNQQSPSNARQTNDQRLPSNARQTSDQQLPSNANEENKRPSIGGSPVWPWHALIWDTTGQKLLCNGALIGDHWVITTKSCFDQKFLMVDWRALSRYGGSDLVLNPLSVVVKLGKSRDLTGFERTEQIYGINRVYAPASAFDFETIISGRDSPVLVELRSLVSVNTKVQPISLQLGGVFGSNTGKSEGAASFWAADRSTRDPQLSQDQLRYAEAITVSCQTHNERYSVCAETDDEYLVNLQPTVKDNLGSPLVTREGASNWQLIGLKTKRYDGDAGVYFRLQEVIDWVYRRVHL
ncbi:uncharacterized protein LOC144448314 [Glandiceps talaboti]